MEDDYKLYEAMMDGCRSRMTGFMVGLLICCIMTLFFCSKCNSYKTGEVTPDTLIIRDTFRDSFPVPVHDTILRYKKEKPITLHDTAYIELNPDSLYAYGDSIVVPISQKEYTDDSTYRAWVSGYNAQLDSIHVYRESMIITRRERNEASGFNVSIGGGLGYGIFTKKPDVFLGLTAGWNLNVFTRKRGQNDKPPDWGH
jgi:hypothetical protein